MSRRPAIAPPTDERLAYAKLALEAVLYVNEAADWAHQLIMAECQKPGDYRNAMRRVAKRFSLPYCIISRHEILLQQSSVLPKRAERKLRGCAKVALWQHALGADRMGAGPNVLFQCTFGLARLRP
jgi:hypothetical protein